MVANGPFLIGVDLGTSEIKTTLFDLTGRALADAGISVTLHQPSPGIAEQNPDDFYSGALTTIRTVVEKIGAGPASVAAIGFDGQMGGIMAIDRDWNAITPWYTSTLDTRYRTDMDAMLAQAGQRMLELSGAMPIIAPRIRWWQREHPSLYKRISKVLILANYVAGRMASLKAANAFIDPSYLTWSGLSDTARRVWSEELITEFAMPVDLLPRIIPAATVIGVLAPEAARACGLAAGVPLVAGAGDQVAGFIGAGLVDPGELIDVAGTFPVFATCLSHFVADTRHQMLQSLAGPLSDNHWYPMMYISGGGLTHRWFCEQFGGVSEDPEKLYQALDAQAATLPPGAQGLLFIPHLAGRSCPPDPNIRGAWLGFTWNHTRAHFYRAVLESIAYDYAQALAVVRDYVPGASFGEVRVIGGGANSTLWNQIKADVLGLPYVRLHREDIATLGSAIIAGHAVGVYPDMAATARQIASTTGRIEPRREHQQIYQQYAAAYRDSFDQLRAMYDRLAGLP